VLRTLLGQAPQADHALPLELQNVLAYEQFLSVAGPYEGPVCALVDQHEVAATDHDAGVQARAQVASNYDVEGHSSTTSSRSSNRSRNRMARTESE
jgi:hypothetical protein